MNTGIQDAMALAPLLADALAAHDSVGLDAYEAARRPVAQHVITTSDRLTRAASIRNPALRGVRNLAFGAANHVDTVKRNLALGD
jgi:2-polyprenyl-6-methoxyphenol hydroxylase-like FAD-dependent oxidoreductase